MPQESPTRYLSVLDWFTATMAVFGVVMAVGLTCYVDVIAYRSIVQGFDGNAYLGLEVFSAIAAPMAAMIAALSKVMSAEISATFTRINLAASIIFI